ncbi:MAG: hypothetical protein K0R08_49 [Solimicrobium sp.]|jgi:hypothetical protein|nr:hypothetical protein [Solimicrobium sp.]
MESLSNRSYISYHPHSTLAGRIQQDKSVVDKWVAFYTQQLEEWVAGASTHNRDNYLAVVNALLPVRLSKWDTVEVVVDCQGLDSLPPLPVQYTSNISLILKGQPNISLRAFLADLPKFAIVSLTFCDNDTITTFSSEIISFNSSWQMSLHLKNCPNFTRFQGIFNVSQLKLSDITVQSLWLCRDSFPELQHLELNDNRNLTSIQVRGNFCLDALTISGNHNSLATFPAFPQIESINIDPLGLASISEYSWLYKNNLTLRPFLVTDAIELLENHHEEGKAVTTLALVKMAESILTSNDLGYLFFPSYAAYCLEVLFGESAAASFGPPELVLGKIFFDPKFVERDEKKADKFFQLALDHEKNPARKEMLKKMIEFLPQWEFFQKSRLLSLSGEAGHLPSELCQMIFSLGSQEMVGTGFTLRQQMLEEKRQRRLKKYWY